MKEHIMSGKLYVVGTPIGNLGDFSERAKQTLSEVDFIAAEDTRVTLKLLNHFQIKTPMVSYYEHNKKEKGETIIERILGGENCAIVTDAGMPAISDPGEDLVALCAEHSIEVRAVPGPSAFVAALALSGFSVGRFTFEGFLSVNRPGRMEHLQSLVDEKRTMVFYEAPHKLAATLNDMYSYFGDRRIAIVREITKIYEQVIRTTLKQAAETYSKNPLKGEIVLVVEGKAEEKTVFTLEEAARIAQSLVGKGESLSNAAKAAAKETGIKKGDIYKSLLNSERNEDK